MRSIRDVVDIWEGGPKPLTFNACVNECAGYKQEKSSCDGVSWVGGMCYLKSGSGVYDAWKKASMKVDAISAVLGYLI